MAVYLYVLVPVALLILELLYFKIADRLNIIDKPNQRSSHQQITLRGGGIIFPLSILLYFLIAPLSYPWFVLGLMIIAAISFADDIKPQSTLIRLILHIAAAGLLAHQAALWPLGLGMVALALILVIGTINAFNFMDGINGITSGYAFTVMAGLYLCNIHLNFIDPVYLYCLLMGNLVFAFFNFRKKARCFAGDVGSVSMAFCLLFPLVLLIKASGNFIFILFFALYGVDTVLTLIHRLIKRENIFEAHRQHLFQYLANEQGWGHLRVTGLYMTVQMAITIMAYLLWKNGVVGLQIAMAAIILAVLAAVHCWVKMRIISRINRQKAPGLVQQPEQVL